jgi:hypothetical protein
MFVSTASRAWRAANEAHDIYNSAHDSLTKFISDVVHIETGRRNDRLAQVLATRLIALETLLPGED